jgi:hypothetical protein
MEVRVAEECASIEVSSLSQKYEEKRYTRHQWSSIEEVKIEDGEFQKPKTRSSENEKSWGRFG